MKVTHNAQKNTLTIVMDLSAPIASKSGKSLVIASTRGNKRTDTLIDGKALTIGLNAYVVI